MVVRFLMLDGCVHLVCYSSKPWEDVWFDSGLVVCFRVGRAAAWAVQLGTLRQSPGDGPEAFSVVRLLDVFCNCLSKGCWNATRTLHSLSAFTIRAQPLNTLEVLLSSLDRGLHV